MSRGQLKILVDDRVRLLSAALAATRWPADEQAVHRHRPHAHARQTAERMQPYADHPAVRALQSYLDQGVALHDLYGYALSLSWPHLEPSLPYPLEFDGWNVALADLMLSADLPAWWRESEEPWHAACAQAEAAIGRTDMAELLVAFCGTAPEHLYFVPNITYPSEKQIGALVGDALTCIVPPPVAWGDNEPWPFDDDVAYVLRCAFAEYARVLMSDALLAAENEASAPLLWDENLLRIFVAGAVAVFLEQAISPREAGAYVLMERRVNGLDALPETVEMLKAFLAGRRAGHYRHFLDYLPRFSAFVEGTAGIVGSSRAD